MLRIKEIAKEKGVTLEVLSNRIGVNRVTLSRTINGNPTVDTLQKIADALGVSIRELFEPENTEPIFKNENGEFKVIGYLNKDQ